MEKNELEAALKTSRKSFSSKVISDDSQIQNKDSNNVNDVSQTFIVLWIYRLCIYSHVYNGVSFCFMCMGHWFLVTEARSF